MLGVLTLEEDGASCQGDDWKMSRQRREARGRVRRPLATADQELGGVGEGGFVDTAREHPGELPAALLALDALYACDRASPRLFFLDDDVRARLGGYLGEVCDGQDLVAVAELPELRPYRGGRLAAYPGVDLVEDVGRAGLHALLGEPYGQHDPR